MAVWMYDYQHFNLANVSKLKKASDVMWQYWKQTAEDRDVSSQLTASHASFVPIFLEQDSFFFFKGKSVWASPINAVQWSVTGFHSVMLKVDCGLLKWQKSIFVSPSFRISQIDGELDHWGKSFITFL